MMVMVVNGIIRVANMVARSWNVSAFSVRRRVLLDVHRSDSERFACFSGNKHGHLVKCGSIALVASGLRVLELFLTSYTAEDPFFGFR